MFSIALVVTQLPLCRPSTIFPQKVLTLQPKENKLVPSITLQFTPQPLLIHMLVIISSPIPTLWYPVDALLITLSPIATLQPPSEIPQRTHSPIATLFDPSTIQDNAKYPIETLHLAEEAFGISPVVPIATLQLPRG